MPNFNASQLRDISSRILQGAGVTADDAGLIAEELVGANLVGHDSHGVMRIVQYLRQINEGVLKVAGEFRVLKEGGSFLSIDGGFNFGQVVARRALDRVITKARETGTATVLIRDCCHVGRLGSYTQRAARNGFAAMMIVNTPGPGGVAPFGGKQRRLGTSPISIAAPGRDGELVLDMTTSATAEGKVRVAYQKGETIPEGWIIDADGNPSTNPADLYATPPGSVLPLGGPLGFKGSGLSMMIDVVAGIISGSGIARTDLPPGTNGVWLYLLDIQQFLPEAEYATLISRYTDHLKSCETLPGFNEIILPGEIEQTRQREREEQGIDIPEETWRQLKEAAARMNVSLADF